MSENETKVPSLKSITDEYNELDMDALHQEYETTFGERPMVDGVPTTETALLVRKLAYAALLNAYEQADEAVPARTATYAQKAFDTPFTKTGAKRSRDNTIQAFICKRLGSLCASGQQSQHTVAELANEVVENFPESTYKDNPVPRMVADINKFNKGLFPYGVANGLVPGSGNDWSPYTAKQVAKEKVEAAS